MKVRKGQGVVSIDGLVTVLGVRAAEWSTVPEDREVWNVARIHATVVERDPALRGEGRPVKYVQSGEDILLFPVPDGPYWLEVTYHGAPRRV
jgi:hypothetical protein